MSASFWVGFWLSFSYVVGSNFVRPSRNEYYSPQTKILFWFLFLLSPLTVLVTIFAAIFWTVLDRLEKGKQDVS